MTPVQNQVLMDVYAGRVYSRKRTPNRWFIADADTPDTPIHPRTSRRLEYLKLVARIEYTYELDQITLTTAGDEEVGRIIKANQ